MFYRRAVLRIRCFLLQAQGLKRILTTYEKVLNQPEDQFIYLMWHRHPTKPSTSIVIGMLKVGQKHLYLFDASQQRRYEEKPLCILDFYIHDLVQRKGNGHQLFDHMLRQESTSAAAVAIDRPSDAFMQFLAKYYGLKTPVWQSTNFVVYPEFFEGKKPIANNEYRDTGSRSEKLRSARNNDVVLAARAVTADKDAHGAGKDSVAGLLHGDLPPEFRRIAAPDTPLDRKNRRDFGHQSIW
ncbi:hypothetical protein COOONC_13230 [Cooperia oncophora]